MAEFLGSVSQNINKYDFFVRANVVIQDISSNTSYVKAEVVLRYKSFGWQTGNYYSVTTSIAGLSETGSYNSNVAYGSSVDIVIHTIYKTVKHNDDGSGSAYYYPHSLPSVLIFMLLE